LLQISKIAITPVIVCIEWLFYSKSASPKVLASIVVLLAGIALATVTDSQVASQPVGMLVAGVNVVVTGLYQVWAGTKQKELGLNGLQLLHQVSPSSVLLLALLIPCLEPVGWSNPTPDTILGYHLTPAAGFWIVVSSALGLVVTLSTFLFIGATSSLTYNVIGHMKTVLIVTGGVLLFGDTMGIQKLIGLLVAMSGIVWYSQIKMAEANKQ
jgi:solute carrier family 35 protein E3